MEEIDGEQEGTEDRIRIINDTSLGKIISLGGKTTELLFSPNPCGNGEKRKKGKKIKGT